MVTAHGSSHDVVLALYVPETGFDAVCGVVEGCKVEGLEVLLLGRHN